MKFLWTGPDRHYVGDSGGEGIHMSLGASYDCEQFGGKIKNWMNLGWAKVEV